MEKMMLMTICLFGMVALTHGAVQTACDPTADAAEQCADAGATKGTSCVVVWHPCSMGVCKCPDAKPNQISGEGCFADSKVALDCSASADVCTKYNTDTVVNGLECKSGTCACTGSLNPILDGKLCIDDTWKKIGETCAANAVEKCFYIDEVERAYVVGDANDAKAPLCTEALKCACPATFRKVDMADDAGIKCVPRMLDDACTAATDCADIVVAGDGAAICDETCACPTGTVKNAEGGCQTTAAPPVEYGEACNAGTPDCDADMSCKCGDSALCAKMSKSIIGGTCNVDQNCFADNMVCDTTTHKCGCSGTMVERDGSNGEVCMEPVGVDADCTELSDCTGLTIANTECTDDSKCACKAEYEGDTCQTPKPKFGETCADDKDCTGLSNSVCTSTKCACAAGKKQKEVDEVKSTTECVDDDDSGSARFTVSVMALLMTIITTIVL